MRDAWESIEWGTYYGQWVRDITLKESVEKRTEIVQFSKKMYKFSRLQRRQSVLEHYDIGPQRTMHKPVALFAIMGHCRTPGCPSTGQGRVIMWSVYRALSSGQKQRAIFTDSRMGLSKTIVWVKRQETKWAISHPTFAMSEDLFTEDNTHFTKKHAH